MSKYSPYDFLFRLFMVYSIRYRNDEPKTSARGNSRYRGNVNTVDRGSGREYRGGQRDSRDREKDRERDRMKDRDRYRDRDDIERGRDRDRDLVRRR